FGAGPASAQVFCNGVLTGPVSGDVIVFPGSNCTLLFAQVTGNVTNIGGGLEILGSTVGQNVISINGMYFAMNGSGGSSVQGNVILIGTSGVPAPFGPLSLRIHAFTTCPVNVVCNSFIGQNLKLVQNTAPFVVGDPSFCDFGNTIGQNLISVANTASPFSVRISLNTIGQNLVCIADTPPATGIPGSNF